MVTLITCQHLSIFCFDYCQKFFFRIFNSFSQTFQFLHFLAIIFGYSTFWLTPHVPPSTNIVIYELVPASPAVSCMSGSSNLDSFHDGRQVAVLLVSCGVLSPGLVQHCSHSLSEFSFLMLIVFVFTFKSLNIMYEKYNVPPGLKNKTNIIKAQLWIKLYHSCSSTRMALVLINP